MLIKWLIVYMKHLLLCQYNSHTHILATPIHSHRLVTWDSDTWTIRIMSENTFASYIHAYCTCMHIYIQTKYTVPMKHIFINSHKINRVPYFNTHTVYPSFCITAFLSITRTRTKLLLLTPPVSEWVSQRCRVCPLCTFAAVTGVGYLQVNHPTRANKAKAVS